MGAAEKIEQRWFTTREAAAYLGITVEALHKHRQRGKLMPGSSPSHGRRFGLRFTKEALEAFITGDSNDGGQR